MPKISQRDKRLRAAAIVAGILKRLPADEEIFLSGKALTRAQLVALFQSQVDALDAVAAARSVFAAAVAKERAVARTVNAAVNMLRMLMPPRFGVEALADFGLKPPKKPGPKTAAAKLAGAEKLRATRKARGTMGRRQKQKLRT